MDKSLPFNGPIAPGVLQRIENLPIPSNQDLNPDFDLGAEFLTQSTESTGGRKHSGENITPAKKRLRLSLPKHNRGKRFLTVTAEQSKDAAKGVVPANTKNSNEWAMRNLAAWMTDRNQSHPGDPVPNDLLTCSGMDASVCGSGCTASCRRHEKKTVTAILQLPFVNF